MWVAQQCNSLPSPFWKTKSKHGVLTAQKLLTIQISEKIYPRQKSKNITGLLSWSFRCLTPPSQAPPPCYGWISAPACEFGAKCNPRTISEKKRKKNQENVLIITLEERTSCLAFHSWIHVTNTCSDQLHHRENLYQREVMLCFLQNTEVLQQRRKHNLNDFDIKTFQRTKSRLISKIFDSYSGFIENKMAAFWCRSTSQKTVGNFQLFTHSSWT